MEKLGTRSRIIAIFFLIAIGDALGMPVETFTAEEIKVYLKSLGIDGKLKKYLRPDGHKWFDGRNAGTVTDDWLFSRITVKSLIKMFGFDMDDMAKAHLVPYEQNILKDFGAGYATKVALRNMNNGVHWSDSGVKGGAGNGIAMKIAPIAVYMYAEYLSLLCIKDKEESEKAITRIKHELAMKIYDYTLMTHNSRMALESAFAQIFGILYCLQKNKQTFDGNDFLVSLLDGALYSRIMTGNNLHIDDSKESLYAKLYVLAEDFRAGKLNDDEYIIKNYGSTGKGTGYILNSLPFSYAFFVRNPFSIDALYDVVNAGGDTDTNAAIIGPMLGALNGMEIIPQHLLDGLEVREEVEEVANEFCDNFGIKN